ncbi:hypothetical protein E5288_WYG015087 [Bos mutus]|uniref:Uncharacterized protein n=1 Tax=Bos mutus TaxID=72004 RepID=A0A6B0RME0_9CETA|nr:hypothetical protein [Bos mutus]
MAARDISEYVLPCERVCREMLMLAASAAAAEDEEDAERHQELLLDAFLQLPLVLKWRQNGACNHGNSLMFFFRKP